MLVVVAIDAEVLPVAPIQRVVVMIVVFMVHREEMQILDGEFSTAPGADPGMNPQRLLPVTFQKFIPFPSSPGHNAIYLFLTDLPSPRSAWS
jgi:hypothetical protein